MSRIIHCPHSSCRDNDVSHKKFNYIISYRTSLFYTNYVVSASQKYGYVDILNDAPEDQDTDCDLEQLAFECCERPLLTVYNLASDSGRYLYITFYKLLISCLY